MATHMQERVQPNWRQNRGTWFTQEETSRHFQQKQEAMERILGPLGDRLRHTLVPFGVGGPLDLYRFEQALPGTAFATLDLIFPDGQGPQRNPYGTYELLACTQLRPAPSPTPLFKRESERSRSPYERAAERIARMLTSVARISAQQVFAPGEIAEIPVGATGQMCLLFDRYDREEPLRLGKKKHHLLLCMEIFSSELDYARCAGAAHLLSMLMAAGHYPYSDLDRSPVI
jgi:hypothetical protein